MKNILFLTFFLYFFNSFGQTGIDTVYLKKSLTHLFDKYHIPDASIIVSQNGEEIFKLDKNNENANKNYFIGSCSKSFTALAVLQLVDAGKIELDSPVQKYLPWFLLKNKKQSEKITIRHLLNQTSGMKTSDGFFDLVTSNQILFEKEFSSNLNNVKLLYVPGAEFNYCNANYIMLGLIITKVSNQSYESYLEENIFSEIGMQNTYASYEKGTKSNVVTGYQDWFHLFKTTKQYKFSDFFVPTGLITSNSDDMARYLNCILNKGITQNGDTLLSQKSLKLLTTSKSKGYAMGWMTDDIVLNTNFRKQNDISFVFHLGSINRYISSIAIYEEKNITTSILANTNSFEFTKEALNVVLASTNDNEYKLIFSKEKIFKKSVLVVVIIVFIVFLINIKRWHSCKFKFNLTFNFHTIIRLFVGLAISFGVLFVPIILYQIPMKFLINFQPDFAYSFLFISIVGILSSLVRYLGATVKLHPLYARNKVNLLTMQKIETH